MRDDQRRDVTSALLKVAGVALGIGLLLAAAVFVLVKALGLSGGTPTAHTAATTEAPPSTLPTRALTPSGSPSETASAEPGPTAAPTKQHAIMLAASPVQVPPGGRISLTGFYPGADNMTLQVQSKQGGSWGPFADVTAQVHGGSFETYVITSRTGVTSFRVVDTSTRRSSNPVKVRVG